MDEKRRAMGAAAVLAAAAGMAISGPVCADTDVTVLDQALHETPNGVVFTATKVRQDGQEVTWYERDGLRLTAAELKAWVQANPPPKIDPPLQVLLAQTPARQMVDVTILLEHRPGGNILREVAARHQPNLDAIVDRTAEIRRSILPQTSMSAEEEQQFLHGELGPFPVLTPAQQKEIHALGLQAEAVAAAIRDEARPRIAAIVEPQQAAMEAVVTALGGKVNGRMLTANGMDISIPAGAVQRLAAEPAVAVVYWVPPVEKELDVQATSLGLNAANGFWSNGIDGDIWDAGVLDTGVQQDHPAFSAHTFSSNIGASDSDGHGTGVCGIMTSGDATFRGMAFDPDRVVVSSFNSGVVQSNADWMITGQTVDGDADVINISGGYGTANDTDYSIFDQFFDGAIDDNTVVFTKSCGNNGSGTTTITHPAPAYNLLAVANMNDLNTVTRNDDVRTGSSSRGPTLSGRRKPDIAAPGNNSMTTNNNWAGAGANFANLGGTSAAAPHVGGGALLLTDLRNSDVAYVNKAILLNTADAWADAGTDTDTSDDGSVLGSEWNKTYGWGYLDLGEAYINGTDVSTGTINNTAPDYRFYVGNMFNYEKATLAWNRHTSYNGSNNPTSLENLTDLDLYLYRQSDGGLVDSSTTISNNVEQVDVGFVGLSLPPFPLPSLPVVLKVDTWSIDADVGTEGFALAREENFTFANGPSLEVSTSVSQVSPGQPFEVTLFSINSGDLPAHNVFVTLGLPAGYEISGGGPTSVNIGTVNDGTTGSHTFLVTAACDTSLTSLSATTSSFSYGESFSDGPETVFFSPSVTALAQDMPVAATALPGTFSFGNVANEFAVIGLFPGAADRSLGLRSDACVLRENSTQPGTSREFVLVNGYNVAPATFWADVSDGGSGVYEIEYDLGFDRNAPDVLTGRVLAADEIVEVHEYNLAAGQAYRLTVDVTAGITNFSIHRYNPARTYGEYGDANQIVNNAGSSGTETMDFLATEAGVYGFVLVNENHNSSVYDISIQPLTVPNDDCAGAQNIGSLPYANNRNNEVAGSDSPPGSCNSGGAITDGLMDNSIWYRYFSPVTQRVNITVTEGTAFDMLTAVYSGSCAALAEVTCADQPEPNDFNVDLLAGNTYFIKVGDWGTSDAGGDYTIQIDVVNNCACELDGTAGVDVFDLLAYLDLWFVNAAGADIDGAAGVDVFDLLFFLDCWFPASAGSPC